MDLSSPTLTGIDHLPIAPECAYNRGMAKMLGKTVPRACPYHRDCCSDTRGKGGKLHKRNTKRSERQQWRKSVDND